MGTNNSATPHYWGWLVGRLLRALFVLVLILLVLLALGVGVFYVFIYPQTATVTFENKSDGMAMFFVDDNIACREVYSGQFCTVAVRTFRSHQLYATDFYGSGGQVYSTPKVSLQAKTGERYQYLACGETGTPGENCGLFAVDVVPNTY